MRRVAPVEGAEEQGDPLAGDFVDDDELGVFAAGFAGDDGGGGDAEDDGEGDAGEEGDEESVRRGMGEPGAGGPEQDCGDGAPGAGAGLAEAGAEEGGDGPPAGGVLMQVPVFRIFGDTRLLCCLAERFPMVMSANARCSAKALPPAQRKWFPLPTKTS